MSYYKSDKGYLMIGVQPDVDTAVTPDVAVPLQEESIVSEPNNQRVNQIVGIDWKSNLTLQGLRTNGGNLKIYADPTSLGHFLNMTLAKGSTSGDADGYTHPFTNDTPAYYTIEILKGNYVHRLVGVQLTKLNLSFDNGNLMADGEVVAKSKFNYGTLKTALSGTGETTVEFDESFDDEPCYGLVAGDTIQVWDGSTATDVVIDSVAADNKSITCTSTDVAGDVGALITLKAQTPSYETLLRPFRLGKALVGIGADETAATSNAGAYATATPADEITFELVKDTQQHHASGDEDPILLEGIPDGTLTLKKLFTKAEDVQQWNDVAKRAVTIIMTGDEITSGNYASLTLKMHNVKPNSVQNKLSAGEYIYDETEFNIDYDDTDDKAITVSLTNGEDGTNY